MTRDARDRLGRAPTALWEYVGLIAVIGLLVLVFSMVAENFFTATTFRSIANEHAEYFVIAAAMTFVLVVGGIDLSVGSVLGLSGAVMGVLIDQHGWPVIPAVLACLATGVLCGLINGLIITTWQLPSFIVTLAMMQSARGATLLLTSSSTQDAGNSIATLAATKAWGLSLPFLLALAVIALGQFVLSRTVFGRRVIALGTNAEAVRLSGINPRPLKLKVFIFSGLLASVGAVFQVSRVGFAIPTAGTGFELEAIAAVVIGGTSLMGGRGSVVRSFLGVVIIATLSRGLIQVEAPEHGKWLVTGGVIVAASILDHYRQRLRRRRPHRSGRSID